MNPTPVFAVLALAFVAGCGGGEKPQGAPAPSKSTAPSSSTASAPSASTTSIVANNLNNEAWSRGIRTTPGARNVFMFIADDPQRLPLRPGSTIVFARTGEALVKEIAPAAQTRPSTVFVVVDRDLDPADGFPNPIKVK
jgi:hypothetical protein